MFKIITPQPHHSEVVARLTYCFEHLLNEHKEAPNEGAGWRESNYGYFSSPEMKTVLILDGTVAVGIATIIPYTQDGENIAVVESLYIRPSKRRVGFKACKAFFEWLHANGATMIEALCLPSSYTLVKYLTRRKQKALLLIDKGDDVLRDVLIALK